MSNLQLNDNFVGALCWILFSNCTNFHYNGSKYEMLILHTFLNRSIYIMDHCNVDSMGSWSHQICFVLVNYTWVGSSFVTHFGSFIHGFWFICHLWCIYWWICTFYHKKIKFWMNISCFFIFVSYFFLLSCQLSRKKLFQSS